MAGLIRRDDVEAVRERTRIEDVVAEYVTLKTAGVGSLKGLCPFHDERSPSFNVRPQVGRYHCFGCDEGGDVIAFLQAIDHLSFTEAVERLASRLGYTLRYEEGGGPDRAEHGKRQRLLDANAAAEAFFRDQLTGPAAQVGRTFLSERGFDRAAADQFGVGFAPQSWDALTTHLKGRGFTEHELTSAGLLAAGDRGAYDRFRGRLVWPIRDITGATVGFGARRLLEDDQGPKYLNTPQTQVYNKSAVLYGIDLAKREIARRRQVVVVEGYTDVMAMHLSGVPTAVATCGTAFGTDHIKIVRRLLVDDDARSGEVVFTFDGDAAGQKAALRAFEEDQRFVAQTYVAVEQSGMDPCELRQAKGPDALPALVADRTPLFEFAIVSTLSGFDLDHAEGRVQGLRAAAPVVAQIRDSSLRPEYARRLAGLLGMDVDEVRGAVAQAAKRLSTPGGSSPGGRTPPPQTRASGDHRHADEHATPPEPVLPRPDLRDPVLGAEGRLVQVLLQFPSRVPDEAFSMLSESSFTHPAFVAVFRAVQDAGTPSQAGQDWMEKVTEAAPNAVQQLVRELAVAPLPVRGSDNLTRFAEDLVRGTRQRQLLRRKAELHSKLQRAEATGDAAALSQANTELMALQRDEHALRGV